MSTWKDILSPETLTLGEELTAKAAAEREKGKTIFPPQDSIFRALELTPPDKVRCVLVGQDPYHEVNQANGLAFSVNPGVPLPPSLKNIYKELSADIGCDAPASGDLTAWAEQGVLLLNTVLTVEKGTANSHSKWGWQRFVHDIIEACSKLPRPVVFLLWGGQARAFVADLQLTSLPQKACIWSSHPSPLGARKGNDVVPAFIGSRPFSKTNRLLLSMEVEPIDWTAICT